MANSEKIEQQPSCFLLQGLVDDIAALRPTIFAGVPRVFDRIYAGVMAKVRCAVPC